MKTKLALAIIAASHGIATAAPPAEVRCTDGSRFKGSLVEITADRARFEADFLAEPVPLKLDHILEIGLPPNRGDFSGDHIAAVALSNGDILRGELIGVSDTEISLKTWYAGEMKFRRQMVDTLDIQDRPDVLYAGPTGLDGWTVDDKDTWVYEEGILRSQHQGTISRKLDLPAKARFSFDVAWRSTPRFRFIFFSDDVESQEPDNCYILSSTNGRYVQLNKRTSRNNSVPVGNLAPLPEFLSKEKIRLELLVDRKTGLIRLLVNGRIVVDWTDPEPQAGRMGGGIHFNSLDSSPLRYSRMEITSWDGVLEGKAADQDEGFMEEDDAPEPKDEPEPDPTRVRLRNNDHVAGEMLGIENGKVKLNTTYGELNLPVARLRSFALRSKKEKEDYTLGLYEKPRRYNGDVRAWFTDGTHVTFRLESADAGRLKGYAQPFGKVDFDAKAFSRVEFNIYNPEFDTLRNVDERW